MCGNAFCSNDDNKSKCQALLNSYLEEDEEESDDDDEDVVDRTALLLLLMLFPPLSYTPSSNCLQQAAKRAGTRGKGDSPWGRGGRGGGGGSCCCSTCSSVTMQMVYSIS